MSALAIEAKGLSKTFGTRKALDNLSFSLPEGAFLSIFGANGAGKTTLLRLLSTLTHPSSGSIKILGLDSKESPELIRRNIGLISHKSMLYPDLTAEENLLFFAKLYGVANPEKRAAELLSLVGLTARRHDAVRTFSRGMTQRLAIARALVHDPKLVFLDEPYSGLDPRGVEIFDDFIASVRANRSFVLVSHDLQKGLALASDAMFLAEGKIEKFQGVT